MLQPNFIAGYIVHVSPKHEPMYLLLKRTQNVPLPGIWQIVTGKVEAQETAANAAVREIKEETGIIANDIYNIDVTMFYDQYRKGIAFNANFCAVIDSKEQLSICSKEHDEFKWCFYEEAVSLLAFPSQKETLKFIHKNFVLNQPDQVNKLNLSK